MTSLHNVTKKELIEELIFRMMLDERMTAIPKQPEPKPERQTIVLGDKKIYPMKCVQCGGETTAEIDGAHSIFSCLSCPWTSDRWTTERLYAREKKMDEDRADDQLVEIDCPTEVDTTTCLSDGYQETSPEPPLKKIEIRFWMRNWIEPRHYAVERFEAFLQINSGPISASLNARTEAGISSEPSEWFEISEDEYNYMKARPENVIDFRTPGKSDWYLDVTGQTKNGPQMPSAFFLAGRAWITDTRAKQIEDLEAMADMLDPNIDDDGNPIEKPSILCCLTCSKPVDQHGPEGQCPVENVPPWKRDPEPEGASDDNAK